MLSRKEIEEDLAAFGLPDAFLQLIKGLSPDDWIRLWDALMREDREAALAVVGLTAEQASEMLRPFTERGDAVVEGFPELANPEKAR
jgi:hypothetical protein